MTISNTGSFSVTDQTAVSGSTTFTVQPAAGAGTGKGRLIHPSLGTYDYPYTPTHTHNVDTSGPLFGPTWSYAKTLGGAVVAKWDGALKGTRVVERWAQGDVGTSLAFLRQLWAFYINPPDPTSSWVKWCPTYATASQWNVVIVSVTAGGGQDYMLDRWLAAQGAGWAPQPVEIEMRIVSAV